MNSGARSAHVQQDPGTICLPPVVIIDDNPDDIFLIEHRITASGVTHPVVTFDTAQAAFDFLQPDELPQLVFCDIRMPTATGFDFLQWVRARPELARLKVVMLSTSDLPDDIEQAVKLGADGYLIKFPPPSVLAKVINGGPTGGVHAVAIAEPVWRGIDVEPLKS